MVQPKDILPGHAFTKWCLDGESALTDGERVLMRLRWFDWVSAGDLLDSMDVTDPRERQVVSRALYYRVQQGQIEARGDGVHREYRLVQP